MELFVYILAVVLVLVLCYYSCKFIGKRYGTTAGGHNIKIMEKVMFSQDKGIAIVKICDEYYCVGISNQSINILTKLDNTSFTQNDNMENKPDFISMVKKFQNQKNKPEI
ncbi:MAG: flagellar biosynthetic protein FliO [Oscillospiraceae bacterium]